ncbi:MAG TPA: RDD family protein [Rariglobus sp.]|jgi:uncharacterized RDD family membrane protein YckC|nr:RDD family protein [Rariglobus sp.]
MQWYYAINGQRQGPVNQAEFERLVSVGTITPDTLVWRKPMAGWQSLTEVLAADPEAIAMIPPEVPPLPDAAAPVSHDPSAAMPGVRVIGAGPMVYGGFWRRVAARIIDWLILGFAGQIVIGVIGSAFFHDTMTMMEKLKGRDPSPEQMGAIFGFLSMAAGVSIVLGVIYDCVFLRKYSATPGKLALGLALYRSDGSPLTIGRIIGRYFAMILNNFTLGLSYLVVAFDDEKRGVHDYVCDTRVVRTER